jgi:predicted transcriptional regulator
LPTESESGAKTFAKTFTKTFMLMANIKVTYGVSDVDAEKIKTAKEKEGKIKFLRCEEIYGSEKSTIKGAWKSELVTTVVEEDGETTTYENYRCCWVTDDNKIISHINNNVLLRNGDTCSLITAKGSVREWAENWVREQCFRYLEIELAEALANILNSNGLTLVQLGKADKDDHAYLTEEWNFAIPLEDED